MKIKRVLFDLDGTLFDTQKFHAQAEASLMFEHGVKIDPDELSAKYAGWPTEKVFETVLNCDQELAIKLTRRKWKRIFPRFQKVKALGDLKKLLADLSARNIEVAIGTASPVDWALLLLVDAGIVRFFDKSSIISGDMCTKGKPDPEIWFRAARNIPCKECLVVEDGTAGVQGALVAGMSCALLLPKRYEGAIPINNVMDVLSLV